MLSLTKIALAAAIALGGVTIGSVASQASSAGEDIGGFHVGPMGQWLGGPSRGYRSPAFAYVPQYHRTWRHERDGRWYR
jgi:hypothetical protein